jgi:hypothetical protein
MYQSGARAAPTRLAGIRRKDLAARIRVATKNINHRLVLSFGARKVLHYSQGQA